MAGLYFTGVSRHLCRHSGPPNIIWLWHIICMQLKWRERESDSFFGYLQSTLIVWVETTFSVSCIFNPWQITTRERLLGSTTVVIFELVVQPPGMHWVQRIDGLLTMASQSKQTYLQGWRLSWKWRCVSDVRQPSIWSQPVDSKVPWHMSGERHRPHAPPLGPSQWLAKVRLLLKVQRVAARERKRERELSMEKL